MVIVDNAGLGTRLRKLRLRKGLTQQQLASPRYTHAHVSTIESGRRQPSDSALAFFAEKLGVDPEQILTGRPPGLNSRLRLRLELARQEISNGDIDTASRSIQDVLREGKEFHLERIVARALELQGVVKERSDDHEAAIALYERAEARWRNGSPTACAYAIAGQIRCTFALGDVHHAIYIGESYLSELNRTRLRSPDAAVRVLCHLVAPYQAAGSRKKADEAATECLKLSSRVEQPEALAPMYFHIARVQIDAGDYADADVSLGKAKDLFEELEFTIEVGLMHLARGVVLSRTNDTVAARAHLEQALAILENGPDRDEWANALMELGRLERIEGNLEAANEALTRSLELMGEDGAPRYLAWASRELAHTLMRDDPLLAEKHALHAIELFGRASQPIEVARTNLLLCTLKGQQREPSSVLAHASAASAALEAAAEL